MARIIWYVAAAIFIILSSTSRTQAQELTAGGSPPEAVMKAIATAQLRADDVMVGAFINDIHEIDARTHTYSIDVYIWFRWRDPSLNPVKTMEFMNRYPSSEHQFESLLDEPKQMPDGTFYGIVRQQGMFSSKFTLSKYPFDQQRLLILIEDNASSVASQRYVADVNPITMNPAILLPGYTIGSPRITISDNTYPTNFGDFSSANNETYSRATIEVPVSRPLMTVSIKTFLPVLLIVLSCTLVLFVRPSLVEGRIGLAITALLTLVALQLTATANMPEVDYLMLIDKAYLASYAFIIAILTRVVATSWVGWSDTDEAEMRTKDRRWALILLISYVLILGISAAATFEAEMTDIWRA